MGAVVVAFMKYAEGMVARRWRSLAVSGEEVTGVVAGARVAGGSNPRGVFDVDYTDRAGAPHRLSGVQLAGHIAVGQQVQVRYETARPQLGVVDEQWTVSRPRDTYIALALFVVIGVVGAFVI
ncbi:MAG: hypothetical protein RL238_3411 [Actinomycetota bacterium]